MPLRFEDPVRLPVVPALESRSISRDIDARLINCYAEKQVATGGYKIKKRFGVNPTPFRIGPGTTGYGAWQWEAGGRLYHVAGDILYENNVAIYTFATTTAQAYFAEMGQGGIVNYLAVQKGLVVTVRIKTGLIFSGPTQITDVDFPISLASGLVYLNGRLYVLDQFSQLFGSEINDPFNWSALNIISVREEADIPIGIAKHLNYIVVFKSRTVQFYYDAGNPVGSSLSPFQGATKQLGCSNFSSVQSIDGSLLWIATNKSSNVQVVKMDNTQVTVISTPMIERLISIGTTVRSMSFKAAGHRFYVLNFTGSGSFLVSPYSTESKNFSLVYDLDEDLWYFWGGVSSAGTNDSFGPFPYVSEAVTGLGTQVWQDINNGGLYLYDTADVYPTDLTVAGLSVTPVVDIYTPNFDADTANSKTLSRLEFLTDRVPNSQLLVRCNDFDYDPAKWSRYRKLDLGIRDPFLANEGSFTRRAYHFRHQSPTDFQLRAVDMYLAEGRR